MSEYIYIDSVLQLAPLKYFGVQCAGKNLCKTLCIKCTNFCPPWAQVSLETEPDINRLIHSPLQMYIIMFNLVSIRQLVFPLQYEDSPTRLRTFLNQPEICGVASFVAECLALFPWFFWRLFNLVSGFLQASAQMPSRGIYVTLPYLMFKAEKAAGRGIILLANLFNLTYKCMHECMENQSQQEMKSSLNCSVSLLL
jgi:hypothetical protein